MIHMYTYIFTYTLIYGRGITSKKKDCRTAKAAIATETQFDGRSTLSDAIDSSKERIND